jgi:hypothetical protein
MNSKSQLHSAWLITPLRESRCAGYCGPPEYQTVPDIVDSQHLPVVFHILDHDKTVEPLEKFTDWEQFQSLASNLISPRIEINSGVNNWGATW